MEFCMSQSAPTLPSAQSINFDAKFIWVAWPMQNDLRVWNLLGQNVIFLACLTPILAVFGVIRIVGTSLIHI